MAARTANVVTIGGSYVGMNMAKELAANLPSSHRVVIVEANSHFNHLFSFPRFAVLSGHGEEKTFVPYTNLFSQHPPGSGKVVQAKALSVHPFEHHRPGSPAGYVLLDRAVALEDGVDATDKLPFTHLVVATGTKLQKPWSMPGTEKKDGIKVLQESQEKVKNANKIVLVGGGAVGVQVAFDIKQLYPSKSVTVIHSRPHLMNKFHPDLSDLILERFEKEGIEVKLGSRVSIPSGGFPLIRPGEYFKVELPNGDSVEADLVMLCTGQTPRSSLIGDLSPPSVTESGFIRVRPSMQVFPGPSTSDPTGLLLERIYAVGDVADSGAFKTVRAAMGQVPVICANVVKSIANEAAGGTGTVSSEDVQIFTPGMAGIHLSLGLTESVKFGNPGKEGDKPWCKVDADGSLDGKVEKIWDRLGARTDPMDFNL
ncbi:hypothetical protein BJ742DRAFT_686192 [Cladochytrium replicatum]|nr:hypothetical protein BJ742DRAFT_686192 [Cladochytrium replicatum]